MLETIHACHRLLLRNEDRRVLLDEVCRTVARVGGFPLVWIGLADADGVLAPAAEAGGATTYLETEAWRKGPESTAFEKGRPGLTGPDEWQDLARRHGIASLLALPLNGTQGTFGVIALGSAADALPAEQDVELFQCMADDIAHTLSTLGMRRERDRLLALIDTAPDLVATLTPDGRLSYCNLSGLALLGADSLSEVAGLPLAAFQPEWAADLVTGKGLPTAIHDGFWEGETALLKGAAGEVPVIQALFRHQAYGEQFLSTLIRDLRDQRRSNRHSRGMEAISRYFRTAGLDSGNDVRPARPLIAKLPVYQGTRTLMLDFDDVCFLRADGHYTHVYTPAGSHLSSQPLSHIERQLADGYFLRTHRSFIINTDYVEAVERQEKQLEIVLRTENHDRIPVSRRNAEAVKRTLGIV